MNKKCLSIVLAAFLLAGAAPVASAGPLDGLAAMVSPGGNVRVTGLPQLELIVVSDWRSPNMSLNTNLNYAKVDVGRSGRTVYAQVPDGSRGVRLRFDDPSFNALGRYDHVVLDLNGCFVSADKKTGALTVSRLTPLNVVSRKGGSAADVPAKEKFISELTDADIFTFVTLKEVDFIFKDGAFSNIKENYGQYVEKYHSEYYKSMNWRMDGTLNLLRDSRGDVAALAVNTLCDWRRNGDGVPQGAGPCSGIILREWNRRYGGYLCRYTLRPLDREDIRVDGKRKSSLWKTLTGWRLDGSSGNVLDYEKAGATGKAQVGDRIFSDTGAKALLWCDAPAKTYTTEDWNNITTKGQGKVANGAVMFELPACEWFAWDNIGMVTGVHGIYAEFSSKKIKPGQKMQLAFDICAGNVDMALSWGHPSRWKVEYSVDGGAFKALPGPDGAEYFFVRPLPCWDKTVQLPSEKRNYKTPYDCGLGLQPHAFNFPDDAVGHERVTVRIVPADTRWFALRAKPESGSESSSLRIGVTMTQKTLIRLGSLFIDYK